MIDAELTEATVYMEANGFSPTIAKRITTLEARKKEVGEKLAAETEGSSTSLRDLG